MSTLTLHMPDEVRQKAEAAACHAGVSLEDFLNLAVAQSLARYATDESLEERAQRATGRGWEQIKKHIPDIDPPNPEDR